MAWEGSMSVSAAVKMALPLGIALIGLLTVAERMYLVNGEHYPRILARDVGVVGLDGLDGLRVSACDGEPLEVYAKADYWVLRCGVAYFQGHTFISHTDPFAGLAR
ncbi:hypothetical protein CJO80_27230 (plasmid) [Ralstonia solanacearum]|nr:hypothetical protein CJO80_27230 [Ralstonia solanacearum]